LKSKLVPYYIFFALDTERQQFSDKDITDQNIEFLSTGNKKKILKKKSQAIVSLASNNINFLIADNKFVVILHHLQTNSHFLICEP
jgi:hypothetical protein